MHALRMAALLSAVWLLLGGCATRSPLIDPQARAVELVQTPFFPQDRYQCGPAALATVLGASGVDVPPDALVSQVYVPGRRGSLNIEMQAAARRHQRISYPLAPRLQALLAELDAGRPVLVLHNYGLPWWPRWHYAVLVGYDAKRQHLLLRSGRQERQVMAATTFMRAWDNADRWALVLLRPGELPADPELPPYLEAATAFERAAPLHAAAAYEAAIARWPESPIAWVGRGTTRYRAGALREAAADYARALALDPTLTGARNNLAMTLLDAGCPVSAGRVIGTIDTATLQGALRDAVADTMRQIHARGPVADASGCSDLY